MQPQLDPAQFREGMARLGAAVSLVTTNGVGGRSGLTATAVCSVTDSPPTLLICVNRNSRSLEVIKENGVVAVNVLRHCHDEMAMRFSSGRVDPAARFVTGIWETGQTGAPILGDALVSFDCRIDEGVDVGGHCVLYCRVEDIAFHDEKSGLFYFDRNFCQISQDALAAN